MIYSFKINSGSEQRRQRNLCYWKVPYCRKFNGVKARGFYVIEHINAVLKLKIYCGYHSTGQYMKWTENADKLNKAVKMITR
jgi:hypothetical protein